MTFFWRIKVGCCSVRVVLVRLYQRAFDSRPRLTLLDGEGRRGIREATVFGLFRPDTELFDSLILHSSQVGERQMLFERPNRLSMTKGYFARVAALYRKANTSRRNQAHRIYPYRLRGLSIDRPNQVWAMDTTYIPMQRGFVYLSAVLDWATRRVLAWRLSNTLTADPCVDALEEAIAKYGAPRHDRCRVLPFKNINHIAFFGDLRHGFL